MLLVFSGAQQSCSYIFILTIPSELWSLSDQIRLSLHHLRKPWGKTRYSSSWNVRNLSTRRIWLRSIDVLKHYSFKLTFNLFVESFKDFLKLATTCTVEKLEIEEAGYEGGVLFWLWYVLQECSLWAPVSLLPASCPVQGLSSALSRLAILNSLAYQMPLLDREERALIGAQFL